MTAPMHKHRPRSNAVSMKMRLAASKNVRTRHKDGMNITLPKAPWIKEEKKNARDDRP